MGALTSALQNFQTSLGGLVIPLGIIGMLTFGLSFLVSPMLPDAVSAAARGYIQKALLIIAFLSFAPAIIRGLAALGGNPGG